MKTNRTRAALIAIGAAAAITIPTVAVDAQADLASDFSVDASVATAYVPVQSYRVFDSRGGDKIGKLPQDGDISLRPAVYVPSDFPDVPETAAAVTYNVTITQTEGQGFINIDGWAIASDATSVIAWDEGAGRLSNSGTSILTSSFDDLGYLGIVIGGDDDAAAHVVIDVTGYYTRLSNVAPATDI